MPVTIPLKALKKHCNPFENMVWGVPLSEHHVHDAINQNRFVSTPIGGSLGDHAARIAFLVINPASDPIEIDVGIPAAGCIPSWFVDDGNHRLAAAIFRGDTNILANVSGDLDFAYSLFGVDCEEP